DGRGACRQAHHSPRRTVGRGQASDWTAGEGGARGGARRMTVTLLIALLVASPFLFILARRPILRRLAVRNAARRPREALVVIVGSLLGGAISTGSAVVGDTMDASIRQAARQHLGPIDELVVARNADEWRSIQGRLRGLPSSTVDGVVPLASFDT